MARKRTPRPATTRQRRRCGRRPQHRRGPRFRRPAHRYSGPFENRDANQAAPFVRLSARRFKKTAQRDRVPAQRSISPCPRATQVAEPDDVYEKLLQRLHVGVGPRVAPTARGTAQCTARVPRATTRGRFVPAQSSPAGATAKIPRLKTTTQEQRCRTSSAPRSCRRRSATATGITSWRAATVQAT